MFAKNLCSTMSLSNCQDFSLANQCPLAKWFYLPMNRQYSFECWLREGHCLITESLQPMQVINSKKQQLMKMDYSIEFSYQEDLIHYFDSYLFRLSDSIYVLKLSWRFSLVIN